MFDKIKMKFEIFKIYFNVVLFSEFRPADPTNFDFELNEEFINKIHDGFLKGDISVGQRRHLIFATALR